MNKTGIAILTYLTECNNGYAGHSVMSTNLLSTHEFGLTAFRDALADLLTHGHIVEIGVSQSYGKLYCIAEDYEKIKEMFIEMGQKLA